jgi:hypothetical protein
MNAVVEQLRPAHAVALPGSAQSLQLDVAAVLAHGILVQEVKKAVMRKDVHYGKIPGTPKDTLYKAGAEQLCMVFRIAPSFEVEDLSTSDTIRYRVTCRGTHQVTGLVLGEAMGEASGGEEKYKWRKPVCDAEFEETPPHLRREKWMKGYQQNPPYKQKQIRTEPADAANTILKMATKRAHVAMVLAVLAASDIFGQDLEDMERNLRDHLVAEEEAGEAAAPAAKQKAPFPADEFATAMKVWQKAVNKGKTPEDVLATVVQFNPDLELSAEQRAAILALKFEPPTQAQAAPAGSEVQE